MAQFVLHVCKLGYRNGFLVSKTICLAHQVGAPTNLQEGENAINFKF